MRVLTFGDLHGDSSLAEMLAKRAEDENVDLIICCGDFTFSDREPKGMFKPFVEKNQKLLFIPGNHDSLATVEMVKDSYPVRSLHGYSVKYEDIGFFGCGKANIGVEQLTENDIFENLKEAHSHISYLKKRIMVTHVHPKGTMAEKMTQFFPGSEGVRRAIDAFQPDIAFCCHVHEAEGLEQQIGKTKVINVGRRGRILDI